MVGRVAPLAVKMTDADGDYIGGGGGTVVDSAGGSINPDNYAQTLAYNGDGTLNTIVFTNGTNTWTQTMSYTSGNLTGISRWVRT